MALLRLEQYMQDKKYITQFEKVHIASSPPLRLCLPLTPLLPDLLCVLAEDSAQFSGALDHCAESLSQVRVPLPTHLLPPTTRGNTQHTSLHKTD